MQTFAGKRGTAHFKTNPTAETCKGAGGHTGVESRIATNHRIKRSCRGAERAD